MPSLKVENGIRYKKFSGYILRQNKEIATAYLKLLKPRAVNTNYEARMLNWLPPQPDWIAVNTDAYFSSINFLVGCGGVMRGNQGAWIAGFSCMAKVNNITEAKCWAVMKALQWAWRMNYKKLWIQCDPRNVVEWMCKSMNPKGS